MFKSYWKYKILIIIHLSNFVISGQISLHNQVNKSILNNSFDFLEDLNDSFNLYNYGQVEIPDDIKNHVNNRVRRWTHSQPLIVRNNIKPIIKTPHFSKKITEAYKLDYLENINFLTIKEVVYIHLFLHKPVDKVENLFSVCLFKDEIGDSSRLVLYELSEQGSWNLIEEKKIINGIKIITQTITTGTLIIALENYITTSQKHYFPSAVFLLNDNNDLKLVQSLNIKESFDATSCLFEDTIFLAITVPSHKSYDENYQTLIIIFVWKGSHFDIFQHLPSANAKQLSLFPINTSLFLVVSNNRENIYGDTRNGSEIFKYNAHTNSFLLFQKLPTSGTTDITYFKFNQGATTQYFLAVANYIDGNLNTKNISVSSVVYKFEDKFVPYQSFSLNGNKQWIPVMIEPEIFVLLAQTIEGVLVFQYNGWKFIPVLNHQLLNSEVNTNDVVYAFVFGNHPIIVVQNNGDMRMAKFYKLHFTEENTLESHATNLLNMCNNTMKNILANDIVNISKKLTGDIHFVGEDLKYLDRSLIGNVDTDKLQLNGKTIMDEMQINRINEANRLILVQMQAINELLQGLPQLLRETDLYTMESFQTNHIILKNPTNALSELHVTNLNSFNYNNLLQSITFDKAKRVEQQFLIENLEVEDIEYKEINGVKQSDFNKLINHNAITSGVVVKGDVFLNSHLYVHGNINGVNISQVTTLTKTGNQEIDGTLNVFDLPSHVIVSPRINGMTFETFSDIIQMSTWTFTTPLFVDKLSIQDLTVGGLFGRSNLDDLLKQSLKLHGNQEISALFQINDLTSGKFTPKLVDSSGFMSIDSDIDLPNIVQFEDAHINKLFLKERLNDIEVMAGVLGVVVLNSTEIQEVIGSLLTENVELMRSISLQGTIKSSIMNEKIPLKITTEPLTLKGNYILEGKVVIENSLMATDIFMEKNNMSIARTSKEALKLTEAVIPVPLIFKKTLAVKNINFDKVNSKSYQSWIIPNFGGEIMLSPKKHFSHVKVFGECMAPHTINGIVLQDFSEKIMRTSGDQAITGNITFQTLYIRSIESNDSLVGEVPLEDLVTYSKAQQLHSHLTLEHDTVVLTNLHAGKIIVRGVVSGHAIQTLYNDTLFVGRKHAIVESKKKFIESLQIKHLIEAKSLLGTNIEEIDSAMHWNKNIVVKNWVEVEQPIFIRNIDVHGTVQGITGFGKNWLLFEGDQTLMVQQTMDHVVLQNMDLTTNLNDIQLQEFSNFLRSDQDFSIAKMDVYGELSASRINLSGYLNDVKAEDILIATAENQYINSTYSFKGELQVKSIDFKSLFGLSVDTLNSFMSPNNECYQRLTIQGAALFKTEPYIKSINNIYVSEILKNVWFLSHNVVLQNFVKFKQLTFTNTLKLQSINHLDIKKLASTYLSKTLQQNISGHVCVSAITAPHIDATEVNLDSARVLLLNNETISHFIKSILNVEDNQVIEHNMRIQYAEINGLLNILGVINGINLNEDVMKMGNKNEISGNKVLKNIKIDNLLLGNAVYIDGVHVKDWLEKAVTRNSSNKHIGGIKHLDYCEVAHISIPSNGPISVPKNVLVQGKKQNVTGVKVFRSDTGRNVNIHFKKLFLHNNLNEFSSGHFEYLVNKYDHNVYIPTEKLFLNEVIAQNINLDSDKNQVASIIRAKQNIPKLSEKYIELNRNILKLRSTIVKDFQ